MLSRLALPAAWLLLLGAASASPAPAKTTSTDIAAATAAPGAVNGTDSATACKNSDGEFKPFCLPKDKDIYYPDSTHYGMPSTFHSPSFPSSPNRR